MYQWFLRLDGQTMVQPCTQVHPITPKELAPSSTNTEIIHIHHQTIAVHNTPFIPDPLHHYRERSRHQVFVALEIREIFWLRKHRSIQPLPAPMPCKAVIKNAVDLQKTLLDHQYSYTVWRKNKKDSSTAKRFFWACVC